MNATSEIPEVEALRERLLHQQPQSRALHDRLLTRYGMNSLRGVFAPIQKGRCSACKVSVAAMRLQRAKAGEFINCAFCSRFLYIALTESLPI